MNLSKTNILDIAQAVVSLMQTPQVSTAPAPEVPRSSAQGRPRTVAVAGTDYAVKLGGKDGRPRLPKAMFNGADTVTINGHAVSVNAEGRSRLPLAVSQALGAKAGAVITLKAGNPGPNDYTAEIAGKTGQKAAPVQSESRATARTDSGEDVAAFFAVVNENYPVGDPRRNMSRAERKAFNRSAQGKAMFASGEIQVATITPKAQAAAPVQTAPNVTSGKKPRTQAQKDATARMLAAKAKASEQAQAQNTQVVSTATTRTEAKQARVTPQYVTGKKGGAVSQAASKVRFNVPASVQ